VFGVSAFWKLKCGGRGVNVSRPPHNFSNDSQPPDTITAVQQNAGLCVIRFMNQARLISTDAADRAASAPGPQAAPAGIPAPLNDSKADLKDKSGDVPARKASRQKLIFWLVFFAVLAVGAFLRFWHLGEQSLWCDETATLSRVSGNITYLLNSLFGQGFPPGWYVTLWAWLQFLKHTLHVPSGLATTPAYLRSLGALLGTLNVAAGYFLARQFMSRRAALFVMLLIAVNPFLVYYSRDLKMYSAFYLMVTLNMALFFRWQNGRHWIWGPLYVFSGIGLIAFDLLGWMLMGVQFIFLLFKRRHRALDTPIWIFAVGVMAACTAGWYKFNTAWLNRAVVHHGRMGISWLPRYNVINWHTLLSAPTINLLGILWPIFPPTQRIMAWYELGPDYQHHLATRTIPALAELELIFAVFTIVVLLLGLLPWRRWLGQGPDGEKHPGKWWHVAVWIILPTLYFALASLPPENPLSVYPHRVIWLQRYMGFMAVAWVLWLGAAVVRLPTWPVRVILGGILTLAMLASALTNNLICRSEPWVFINRPIMKYYNPHDHLGMYIAYSPESNHPKDDPAVSLLELQHLPLNFLPVWNLSNDLWYKIPRFTLLGDDSRRWTGIIHWARINKGLHTLVLADRMGDIHTGPLSTAAVKQALGKQWKLVKTVRFNWYFEWQYYFYSPIRVRVFRRIELKKPPLPAPGVAKPST
jgi:uncharacterized membrane protein